MITSSSKQNPFNLAKTYLSLGESVGLDTTGAEEGLDGIDVHLAGGGWVEQVPSGHDGLLGVGSGHLLSEKLEEHLEVEGAGGLGDHGAQSSLVSGLACEEEEEAEGIM